MAEDETTDDEVDRYRALVESTDDWLWEINDSLVYSYSSPQVKDLLGYESEEVIGRSPFDFMTPDDAQRVSEIFLPILQARAPFRLLENENLTRSGKVVRLETSGKPFFDRQGQFKGYRGIDRDVTERNRLARERADFEAVMEQISEATVFLDRAGNITYLNRPFYDLLGYSPLEILGQPISTLEVPGQVRGNQPYSVIHALDESVSWEGEVQRRRRDGTSVLVWLRARALYDENGAIEGYLGTYFDLTDVKHSERRLANAIRGVVQSLASAIDMRDPFTANHQRRVTALALAIGERLGKNEQFLRGLELGAMIHDVGKIYVPMEILNRPGPLSDQELDIIRTHPTIGAEILDDVDFDWPIVAMLSQHHERIDGTGYPDGLMGKDIVDEALIIGVADVFEAITAHRPYRPARLPEEALDEIVAHRGAKYDPDVADCIIEIVSSDSLPERWLTG